MTDVCRVSEPRCRGPLMFHLDPLPRSPSMSPFQLLQQPHFQFQNAFQALSFFNESTGRRGAFFNSFLDAYLSGAQVHSPIAFCDVCIADCFMDSLYSP
jgi:hypothetical protein